MSGEPGRITLAWVLIETGRPREAEILVDELLQHGAVAEFVHVELALALGGLGRHAALEQLVIQSGSVRWKDVLALIADGSLVDASDVCEQLGSLPAAAYLRMHAGERLIGEGRDAEARAQLARAIAFWRSVRATRFLRDAEGLVARLDAASPGGEPPVDPGAERTLRYASDQQSPAPSTDKQGGGVTIERDTRAPEHFRALELCLYAAQTRAIAAR